MRTTARRSSIFDLESQMTPVVIDWLKSEGLTVEKEVATIGGCCDLVGVKFDSQNVAIRTEHKQRQPIATMMQAGVYMALPDKANCNRGMRLATLEKRFCSVLDQRDEIECAVNYLLRTNHAEKTATGSLVRRNGWWPVLGRLIAVELKLTKIGCVIDQASAKTIIAPESYAALPADIVDGLRGRSLDRMSELGIGLLAVDATSCRVVINPAKQKLDRFETPESIEFTEKIWSRYRGRQ